MDLIRRAVWYVEGNLAHDMSLTDVSEHLGVSQYHLARAFSQVTGQSVMGYVRARRLTEAARRLADGEPDILTLALDSGYGSHEAFTRAFRERFGTTPNAIRSLRNCHSLTLQDALVMTVTPPSTPLQSRLEALSRMTLVGMTKRYTAQTRSAIPGLWQEFAPHIGHVPGQVSDVTYGVCMATGEEDSCIDYSCAVQIEDSAPTPAGLVRLTLAPRTYRVFKHEGHVSELHLTYGRVFQENVCEPQWQFARAPDFERYTSDFDPGSGMGGMEIWIPLEPRQD